MAPSLLNDGVYNNLPPYCPMLKGQYGTFTPSQYPISQTPVISASSNYINDNSQYLLPLYSADTSDIPQSPSSLMPGISAPIIYDFEDEIDGEEESFRDQKDNVNEILQDIEVNSPALIQTMMLYNIPFPIARRILRRMIYLTLCHS